ncbi:MAG: phosphate ABC transporter substrate-binding protein [Myxococcota bacterium]|nr:phosphate ABC transporter substrate-binding protein [Myxococcota bacterium]MDW8363068.1 phosphate ABC transporter substrate-binding protein [Myxococcales bacterium]
MKHVWLAAGLWACSGGHGEGRSAGSNQESASGAPASPRQGQTLTIKGSDTMVILAQRWAEAFMAANPGTSVQVSGGGSGTGIAALMNGTTDLATSSRPMRDRERQELRRTRNVDAVETAVALDALAVYVHTSNSLPALTLEQLKAIYRGRIRNFREVGGPDRPIVLYSRENNSGTYAYFKEHVLGEEDFAPETQTLPGTSAVVNAVARDPNGIGYGGIAYAEGIRSVPLLGADGQPVEATLQNATSRRYPLARHLYIYSPGTPEGLARRFLDFVVSPAGQNVVEGVGYYPLAPSTGQATGSGHAAGSPAPESDVPTTTNVPLGEQLRGS